MRGLAASRVHEDGYALSEDFQLQNCVKYSVITFRMIVTEFALIADCAYLTSLVSNSHTIAYASLLPLTSLALAGLVVMISFSSHHYAFNVTRNRHKFLWSGAIAVLLSFSILLSILFLLGLSGIYPRGTFICQLAVVLCVMLTFRAIVHYNLRHRQGAILTQRAVLVAGGQVQSDVLRQLRAAGLQIIRIVDVAPGQLAPRSQSAQSLINTIRTENVEVVLLALGETHITDIPGYVNLFAQVPVSVHFIPGPAAAFLTQSSVDEVGALRTLQVLHQPLSPFDLALKRAFDMTIASIAACGFVCVLPLIAAAIKIDSSGPIFYRQKRHGFNNRTIEIFKFRTMHVSSSDNFIQAKLNDPRITRVGRFLRATNLDELPQIFNVLLGTMSIVGPRPHALAHNHAFEQLIAPLARRHNVKPGITGWAQVNGCRGETDTVEKMQRRIDCDLYYVDNWSLLLDIKIIVLTLFSRRAYLNAR
jgi:Undecaprenyl-phosphate glucose phosphotransferase